MVMAISFFVKIVPVFHLCVCSFSFGMTRRPELEFLTNEVFSYLVTLFQMINMTRVLLFGGQVRVIFAVNMLLFEFFISRVLRFGVKLTLLFASIDRIEVGNAETAVVDKSASRWSGHVGTNCTSRM